MPLLQIENLHASVEGKPILKGVNLTLDPGQVHSIMGPNGSGKSTLAQVLAGHEAFEVTAGSVHYRGEDLLELEPDERARKGLFLAFQYPVEIPGVGIVQFLKAAYHALQRERGEPEIDSVSFLKLVRAKMRLVEMDESLLKRSINEGFSGGEKKRCEIFQMALLEPTLGILDETDSGLDIDALKIVARGVNQLRRDNRAFLVITHYQRLLNYIVPDQVHVMVAGQIVRSGGKELAFELEERGYSQWVTEPEPQPAGSTA